MKKIVLIFMAFVLLFSWSVGGAYLLENEDVYSFEIVDISVPMEKAEAYADGWQWGSPLVLSQIVGSIRIHDVSLIENGVGVTVTGEVRFQSVPPSNIQPKGDGLTVSSSFANFTVTSKGKGERIVCELSPMDDQKFRYDPRVARGLELLAVGLADVRGVQLHREDPRRSVVDEEKEHVQILAANPEEESGVGMGWIKGRAGLIAFYNSTSLQSR
ncbi:MAG: hypothetical protein ACNA8P_09485, partial [Phycisphaerales bacterium]